jgi:ribosomal protein L37E
VAAAAPAVRRAAAPAGRYGYGVHSATCAHCGARRLRLRGPVTITIRGR